MSDIILKGIIDEDFVNYRVPSMTLMFPKCSFKCEIGKAVCQNSALASEPDISINIDKLCERYINNPITEAVCCQGLEPMDSYEELEEFISTLRNKYNCMDDVVIYSGYTKEELKDIIPHLSAFHNIIIKYGRYLVGHEKHFDDVLGVYLISDNQYAERL